MIVFFLFFFFWVRERFGFRNGETGIAASHEEDDDDTTLFTGLLLALWFVLTWRMTQSVFPTGAIFTLFGPVCFFMGLRWVAQSIRH